MSAFLESPAGDGVELLIVAVSLALAYRAFGSQVFGLPAMMGALALAALRSALPTVGFFGFVLGLAGLLALYMAIGMAMTFGQNPRQHPEERPPADSRPEQWP